MGQSRTTLLLTCTWASKKKSINFSLSFSFNAKMDNTDKTRNSVLLSSKIYKDITYECKYYKITIIIDGSV